MTNELTKNLFDDISKALILLFLYGISPTLLFRKLGPPGPLLDSFQEQLPEFRRQQATRIHTHETNLLEDWSLYRARVSSKIWSIKRET
jgi:hypothetical protein